ncbi:TraB/GumN family protein [Vagococcus fluvialis]|uniref:TraB/GumN family protein n=1 Tax=Vagococcus fluvialis TaxID=2738 RepID=UPI001A8C943B|nr:TraB/GumN family protein [Vagococcus fluvialis]MBO0444267.1 TraB/GumN family protein [Vagococcus fluvialis]
MKKQKVLFLLLILLLSSCGRKSITTETREKQLVDWPLYEINLGETTKGYILGSIHIGNNDWYPFPEEITDAIDNSALIFSEVKYSSTFESNTFNYQTNSDTYEKYILNNYFSKDEKVKLSKVAEDYKINKIKFEESTLADFYSQLQGATLSQQDVVGGVDYRIYNYLQKNDRLTDNFGFETVSDQYLLLNESLKSKLESSTNWINLIPSHKESTKQKEQFMNAYVTGSIQQIETEVNLETLFDTKILIESRQIAWLQDLKEYLTTDKKTFTIVGTAHLYGERGLLNEIKNSGYSINKISITTQ